MSTTITTITTTAICWPRRAMLLTATRRPPSTPTSAMATRWEAMNGLCLIPCRSLLTYTNHHRLINLCAATNVCSFSSCLTGLLCTDQMDVPGLQFGPFLLHDAAYPRRWSRHRHCQRQPLDQRFTGRWLTYLPGPFIRIDIPMLLANSCSYE